MPATLEEMRQIEDEEAPSQAIETGTSLKGPHGRLLKRKRSYREL
jgi:hypothetical protein